MLSLKKGEFMTKRKPWWVKLLISLLTTALVIGIAVLGVFLYVKNKFGINIFETISQFKILTQEVDESKLFPNKFSVDDMESAKVDVNAKAKDLITYSEENGYEIQTTGLTSESNLTGEIRLTDKQIGAIINNLIMDQNGAKVKMGDDEIDLTLIQVKFENINEKSADVNIVVKLDISSIKNKMNSFPLSLFNRYIPKTLYISATSTVTKGETEFEYTITGKSLTINNLNKAQTENICKVLDLVAKVGTAQNLCESISTPFINALIGNESASGFAYSLKSLGAKDYNFEVIDETNYFVIKIG